jgi:hypothetical protein
LIFRAQTTIVKPSSSFSVISTKHINLEDLGEMDKFARQMGWMDLIEEK